MVISKFSTKSKVSKCKLCARFWVPLLAALDTLALRKIFALLIRVPPFSRFKDLTKSNRRDYVSMSCELKSKISDVDVNIWGFAATFKLTMGTKTHPYELIFNPHIEEDQTKIVCFIKNKKINLINKNLVNLRVMIFTITMELHCYAKKKY